MSLSTSKNKESMLEAWKDVVNDKTPTDWALFGYEGQTNDLCLVSKGDGGLDELKYELNSGKVMYGFLRVIDPKTTLPKCVLLIWQGEGAPQVRKATCANHIRDVRNLLKGAHVTINARTEDDVEEEVIFHELSKSSGSGFSFKERISEVDRQSGPVGTTYKKVIPSQEINSAERDMFWRKEEEEEKKRQAEEKRKKEEMRLRLEAERKQREAEESLEVEQNGTSRNHKSATKEAEELIQQRKIDPRAMFERNTSAGQMMNARRGSESSSSSQSSQKKVVWPPQQEPSSPPASLQSPEQPKVIEPLPSKEEPAPVEEPPKPKTQPTVVSEDSPTNEEDFFETGLRAEALYDYQAADDTEISFYPGDIITDIEQIDPGWWQGYGPDGDFGLFPANYVQLLN